MPDRKPRPSTPEEASRPEHSPKGTPTDDRHTTETAGGQHKHDQPHTTGHPAKGRPDQD